ncbi:acyl-CoA thioesterase [Empedobacter sp. UBA7494]|uniref:acyl-CoA thioesterase n=1 Tax=Empedobacter sp. UBA7494 TaxID=1946450 RepID=UPI0025B80A7B|nr:thioesterase family protein [Empedobacter sp. UBA7494]
MSIENFKFFKPLEPRWSDFDPIGHVNNVFYFEYFQIGRAYYMMASSKKWQWTQHMFVIAHMEASYQKELRPNVIEPRIGVRVTKLGNKSFDFEYIVTSKSENGEDVIHCIGKSTQVMYDMEEKKSMELPDWVKNDFKNYEGNL